jgi:hypothetical protein
MLLGYEMVTVESRNNASSAETFTYDDIEWSW